MSKEDSETSMSKTVVQSPQYRIVYSNQAKMAATPWDFRVTFAHINPAHNGEAVTEEEMTVVMSPQHAKAFMTHWQKTIKGYEEAYGEINDPTPKITEIMDKVSADQKNKDHKKTKATTSKTGSH